MLRFLRLSCLLALAGLAGCATPAPRPARPPAPAPFQPPPQRTVELPRREPAVPPLPVTVTPFFHETGLASFYGRAHAGKRTANGEKFDHHDFTAAHRTLAFGTLVRVTSLATGKTVTVEITDRGPRVKTRIVDLSLAAARALGMQKEGITRVSLEAYRGDQVAGTERQAAFSGIKAR